MAVMIGAATLALGGTTAANASPPGSSTCPGGILPTGTYANVTVSGGCTVPDGAAVTVTGNILVNPGGFFDASTHSTLSVGGNVVGVRGAMVALGCTEAHTCDDGNPGTPGADRIRGNVSLSNVSGAAINGVWIGGNLTESGGGAGIYTDFPPFSVKDNTVNGNLMITGLRTGWFGIIRNTVGGNVMAVNNRSANDPNDPNGMQTDSSEVVSNTIGGNLVCINNTPRAQVGDSDGAPNTVHGVAVGECASLVSR